MSSSVSAARSATPGDTSPSSDSRSADVTDTSRFEPATTPRVMEPVVRIEGGGRVLTGGPRRRPVVSGA